MYTTLFYVKTISKIIMKTFCYTFLPCHQRSLISVQSKYFWDHKIDKITFQMGVNVHPLIQRSVFSDLVKKSNSLSENNFLEENNVIIYLWSKNPYVLIDDHWNPQPFHQKGISCPYLLLIVIQTLDQDQLSIFHLCYLIF